MGRGRTQKVLVTQHSADGSRHRAPDELIVEEPLSIRLDGVQVATTMRTPGHDFELAAGFCHTEGLLDGAPVLGCRYCAEESASATGYNVVTVQTGGLAPTPTPRLQPVSSSCGMCGADQVDDLLTRLEPFRSTPAAGEALLALVASVTDAVQAEQSLFARTGGVHAAAAFDLATGRPRVVREDIGRHNAVDKVVGHLLLKDSLPATGLGLFVSGRASFEIVQKAWAGGLAVVVAVSAPSALAVETARRANLVLAGFARDGACNLYAPEGPAATERGG